MLARGLFLLSIALLLMQSSCENDVALVQRISYGADAPTESTKNLVLTYAENGYAKVEIHAALAETYSTGELMVKDSVRLYNHKKKQTLETEVLFWNQKDSSIFTESAVIVRSPKGKLFGKGIRTKQDFSNYVLLQPVGSWQIEQNQTIQ